MSLTCSRSFPRGVARGGLHLLVFEVCIEAEECIFFMYLRHEIN